MASGRAWVNGGGVKQLALAAATERVLGQPRRAGGVGLGAALHDQQLASLLEILLLLGGALTLPCFPSISLGFPLHAVVILLG